MILVFDIGKTNKKWVLFDPNLSVVADCSVQIPEIQDDGGFPCEDIEALENWLLAETYALLKNKAYDIQFINISAYGATIVLIDEEHKPCFPVYNYLKPADETTMSSFKKAYFKNDSFEVETGAPFTGMLNSGFQIFSLKENKENEFLKVKNILHLPQYLAFLLSTELFSETTSIGCHTSLWNFERLEWHDWLADENILPLLPTIVKSNHTIPVGLNGKKLAIGVGIHDSSAALYPYISCVEEKFVLVSTGTWTITLNPFPEVAYSISDVKEDVLLYKQADGSDVRASRLFTGRAFSEGLDQVCAMTTCSREEALMIRYNEKWKDLPEESISNGMHRVNEALVIQHVEAIKKAIGNSDILSIYVDGGFAHNDVFLKMLKVEMQQYKIFAAKKPMGSALGAAIVMEGVALEKQFFWDIYEIIEI